MSDFLMPSLGADMEDGLLVEWMVKPGERVERGQVVCAVETQKGAVDVEIWESGTVEELVAEPGERIPAGGVLARIHGSAEEAAPAPAAPAVASASQSSPKAPSGKSTKPAAPAAALRPPSPEVAASPAANRIRITPAARKRAETLGVDPATLVGSGADGAVTLADVEAAAPGGEPAESLTGAAPERRSEPAAARRSAMREAIASAMARSNREIPHYYLGSLIKVEPALRWLQARNETVPVAERALFAALQLRAVAVALTEYPDFNGWYEDGAFRPAPGIHIGVAIALRGGGLIAPALRDVDRLDLAGLMESLRDLLLRARAGQLRSSELTDTSLTVTNLGDLGVDSVQGVIYPPQVALVGFGRVVERPWAEDGKLFAARCVHVSLAADHRVTDGAFGARFLARITEALANPENLWPS